MNNFNTQINWWHKHISYQVIRDYAHIITGNVADFGCGEGYTTILASKNHEIKTIHGFDSNSAAISAANNNRRFTNCTRAKIYFHNFEIHDIGTKIECKYKQRNLYRANYDNAFFMQTLEHIAPADNDKTLRRIQYLVRKGGRILVTVPNGRAYDNQDHKQYFSVDSLAELLSEYFEIELCRVDNRVDKHGERHDRINCLVRNNKE